MEQSAWFWDRIAVRYSKQPIADEAAYEKKLRITRGYLRPGMEVVELGCGTGGTAIHHASYVKRIRAIDISARMLDIAKRKASAAGVDNIVFEQSTLDGAELPAASIDAILGLSILHLLPNKDEVIARVFEALEPGGVFVTSTVCMEEVTSVAKYFVPIGSFFGLLPKLDWFTGDELEQCMKAAGFEIDYRWQPGEGKAVFMVAKKPL